VTTKPQHTEQTPAESYEGNPSKLLEAILPRIKRREPEFDATAARLHKGKDKGHDRKED
jgi:hypothetical protein